MKEHLSDGWIVRWIVWVSACILAACGPVITVQVSHDKQTNFEALRSFSFTDTQSPSKADQLVKQAVETELLKKGYVLKSGGEAHDFQVAYHAALQKKTIWQAQYSPRGVPAGVVPITFNEGTIAIQMLEPRTGKVIWTGQAEEAVDDRAQALRDIQPEVNKILARFPPR